MSYQPRVKLVRGLRLCCSGSPGEKDNNVIVIPSGWWLSIISEIKNVIWIFTRNSHPKCVNDVIKRNDWPAKTK